MGLTVKPDFFIIGAMKCATSTLHDQLAQQAGFFMSEPKEPNFFSDDDNYARGLDWYRDLFASAKDADLKGESSTHYTKLPTYPQTIERLVAECPKPKFIYLMRHPVERLVSHYIHDWTEQKIGEDINTAVENHPDLVDYGRYAYQLEPFLDRFGVDAVKPLFLRAMNDNPQAVLEVVSRYLGHAEPVAWSDSREPQNVSSERLKRTPFVAFMLDNQLATLLRQKLVPQGLRDRVKQRYQMRERPKLDPTVEQNLIDVFDKDLKTLGSWLGESLDCASFNTRTRSLVDNHFKNYARAD